MGIFFDFHGFSEIRPIVISSYRLRAAITKKFFVAAILRVGLLLVEFVGHRWPINAFHLA